MAKSVTLMFQTTSQLVPNGAIFTHYRATITGDADHEVFVPNTATEAVFPSVMAGVYTARYELSNVDGSQVGPGFDFPAFVIVDDVMLNVPTGGEVILGPTL